MACERYVAAVEVRERRLSGRVHLEHVADDYHVRAGVYRIDEPGAERRYGRGQQRQAAREQPDAHEPVREINASGETVGECTRTLTQHVDAEHAIAGHRPGNPRRRLETDQHRPWVGRR